MEVPKYLYKYRCWDEKHKYHKDLLTENKIYFASPKDFNDPSDCGIPINYMGMTREDLINECRNADRYSDDRITEIIDQVLESGKEKIEGIQKWHEEYVQKDHNQNHIGIFSLSEFKNISSMWSHYSNSHHGFCVEFDTLKLDKYFDELAKKEDVYIVRHPTIYTENSPDLIPTPDDSKIIAQLTTKENKWEDEKEFRYIMHPKSNISLNIRAYPLKDGIITKVFLGCKMESKHIVEIAKILKRKNQKIELLLAKMKKDEFGLAFERIDY